MSSGVFGGSRLVTWMLDAGFHQQRQRRRPRGMARRAGGRQPLPGVLARHPRDPGVQPAGPHGKLRDAGHSAGEPIRPRSCEFTRTRCAEVVVAGGYAFSTQTSVCNELHKSQTMK